MIARAPDAVLLDINLPVMDGLETLRHMAAEPTLRQIPVMMISSSGYAENVRAALASGARDFIVKPFTVDTLRERVRRLLSGPKAEPGAPEPPKSPTRVVTRVLVADPESAT